MSAESVRYDTTAGQEDLKRRGIRPIPLAGDLVDVPVGAANIDQPDVE